MDQVVMVTKMLMDKKYGVSAQCKGFAFKYFVGLFQCSLK